MKQTEFDVVIAGGGPVGLSLAAALLSGVGDMKIAICERGRFSVPSDSRSSALSAGVSKVFDALGLWAPMAKVGYPVSEMRITDSGKGDLSRPLFLSFSGDVAPNTPYAHMVPNRVTMEVLLGAVADRVTLLPGTIVTGMQTDARGASLTLSDGRAIRATLAIGADGARSAMRDMAGIGVYGHDYGQSGVVTTIRHALPHEGVAYEHFRPAGPFASLPLPDNCSSLVWTESTQEADRLIALPHAELAVLIEEAMGSGLGPVEILETVQAFPLRLQIARDFVGRRLALIGDAAHVVHPIAGQGLNLGLKDVAALAEVVVEALRLGLDFGGEATLLRYQRWRRFDTALMAMATDALNMLFSNDVAPVRALRDFGLGVVDRMEPVKSQLIRHAAALEDGPKLLRGRAL